jgi:hypothetical protein
VLLGAGGGSLLGLLTAPDRVDGSAQALAPAEQVAPSTTRRPLGRFVGGGTTTSSSGPATTTTTT